MAQKVMIELVDDIDGSEATQSVTFALDGTEYEVDLSDANADQLRNGLEKFIASARREGNRRKSPAKTRIGGPSPRDVRAWAASQGLDVNPRGRVPDAIVEQYLAAN